MVIQIWPMNRKICKKAVPDTELDPAKQKICPLQERPFFTFYDHFCVSIWFLLEKII